MNGLRRRRLSCTEELLGGKKEWYGPPHCMYASSLGGESLWQAQPFLSPEEDGHWRSCGLKGCAPKNKMPFIYQLGRTSRRELCQRTC